MSRPRDDAVLPTTRLLSAVIIPFLLVAFVVLFLFPDDTQRLFAWTITPRMTPMALGAVYLGGAWFFLRAFRATEWHTVQAGFLSVTAFASLMGVATVIHWDRFNHSHIAFWLWAGLYFTTPFLVAATWLSNQRTWRPPSTDDVALPLTARVIIGATGVLAVAAGAFLFLLPQRAIDLWPWTLSPLTARVMGAIFMLGLAGITVLVDPRWRAARLMLQVQGFMMVLLLLAAARSHADFDPSNVMTWLLLVGFVGALAGAVGLTVAMDGRAAATGPAGVVPSVG
jgi:hypothetical protein